MKWTDNPYHRTATEAEDLSYPPSGGRVKQVILGGILPAVILYFAARAWISEEAVWFGRGRSDLLLQGPAARAMAVTYASAGLFCHFRWFWGLVPVYRVFEIGTILSILGFLGGLGFAGYHVLF
ncbi:hypothetical protein [Luteolibacter marinus]|uniref:hypothetical protein n=1 Tax=Luteolibacter marinus TaxID=2776705 RepID=UPI00186853A6|nr:hypothetical protein [Luteolibacter marinus]